MNRRMSPTDGSFHIAVLDRVDVHVLDMTFKSLNRLESCVPNSAFAEGDTRHADLFHA